MGDVVEFGMRKELTPAYTDANGVEWFRVLCSYIDANSERFCFEIYAKTWEDAEERLKAIQSGAKLEGMLNFEIGGGSSN